MMRSAKDEMRFSLLLSVLLSLSFGIAKARAEDPSENNDTAATDMARKLFIRRVSEYQAEHWDEARSSFAAAWTLYKHWQIALNLTVSELTVGNNCEAAEHAAYLLLHAPEDRREQAASLLKEARAKAGKSCSVS